MQTGPTEATPTDRPLTAEEAQAEWDALDREDAAAAGEPAPDAAEGTVPERVAPPAQPAAPAKGAAPAATEAPGISPELLRRLDSIEQQLSSTAGRVGSLQSDLTKIGQAAARTMPAGDAPSQTQIAKAAKQPEAWVKLKQDFPDWAEGVEQFVLSQTPSAPAAPSIDFDTEFQKRIAAEREAIRQEFAIETTTALDAEWQTKARSPEFAAWMKSQPADYQRQRLNTWKPHEILATVRDFEKAQAAVASKARTQGASSRRLAAAAIPSQAGSRPTIAKPESEMSPDELWAFYDEQDRRNQRPTPSYT